MPIYAYECGSCSVNFEVEQRITEEKLKDCPKCGKLDSLVRLIQPIAVQFVGSGFHINDYKAPDTNTSSSNSAPAPCADNPDC